MFYLNFRSIRLKLSCLGITSLLGSWAMATAVIAQDAILPDQTLGHEASIVTPNATIKGDIGDLIEGGAQRGDSLFHSFLDFNVNEGQRVYFAQPASVNSILSRVTGSNSSNIFGVLGVDGTADLVFLNPNGILFGENAVLDLDGSFYASTAAAISLGDGLFSAVAPQESSLLTVQPGVLFFNYLTNEARETSSKVPSETLFTHPPLGDIINNGNLAVNGSQALTLFGNTVLSRGSLTAAGGTVQVLGNHIGLIDHANVDVSSSTGGGWVWIGGDYQGQGTLPRAERTVIGPNVTIQANALTAGHGGQVIIWSDDLTGFYGDIAARGAVDEGTLLSTVEASPPMTGGLIEISSQGHLMFRGTVDTATSGGQSGLLLLDPTTITIANGTADSATDGTDQFAGDTSGLVGQLLSTPLKVINDVAPTTIYESELEGLSGDTDVILQATDGITLEDLADNELLFARGTGQIELTADANADGIGDVVMQDRQDTLKTNGRDLNISGANFVLGTIDTSVQLMVTQVDVDAGGAIPPSGTSGAGLFTFTVPEETGVIEDLDVRFSAAHTWDADLEAILVSPNGTVLELFSAVGGSGDDFQDTVIDDDALIPITLGVAPFDGSFQPEGEGGLAVFEDQSSEGIWFLVVIDNFLPLDSGTLFQAGDPAPWGTAQGTQLLISSFGNGAPNGGNVELNALGNVAVNEVIAAGRGSFGEAGDITVTAGGNISAITLDTTASANQAGDITLIADNNIQIGDPGSDPIIVNVDTGGPIPEIGTTTFQFTVPDDIGAIDDLNVRFSAEHPLGSDLSASLTSPDGTSLTLFDFPARETTIIVDRNFQDTVFDDESLTPLSSGSSPFGGSFQPEGDSQGLAIFDGELATGLWSLEVTDSFENNDGTLLTAGDIAPWGTALGTQLLFNDTEIPGLIDASGNSLLVDGGNVVLEAGGNIEIIGAIRTIGVAGASNGGDITLSSQQDISVEKLDSSTTGELFGGGNGGDISIASSLGDITVNEVITTFSASSLLLIPLATEGRGGDVSISAPAGDILLNGGANTVSISLLSLLGSDLAGDGGDISLASSAGDIIVNGTLGSSSAAISLLGSSQTGDSGNISITTSAGDIVTNGNIFTAANSSAFSGSSTAGNGGNISLVSISGDIIANGDISSASLSPVSAITSLFAAIPPEEIEEFLPGFLTNDSLSLSGDGGDIFLSSASGNITLNQGLNSASFASPATSLGTNSAGNGGDISLLASKGTIMANQSLVTTVSVVEQAGITGMGGTVYLEANTVSGLEVSTLSSAGESGNVNIQGNSEPLLIDNLKLTTSGQVEIANPLFTSPTEVPISAIDPGEFELPADMDSLFEESLILEIEDTGQSGNTLITNSGDITLSNVDIQSDANGAQRAGDVTIITPGTVNIENSQINSNTNSEGDAGEILIQANRLALNNGTRLLAATDGTGDGGSITLTAQDSTLSADSLVSTSTTGAGVAGNITFNITDRLEIDGSTVEAKTEAGSTGLGGNIAIANNHETILRNGGQITVNSDGTGRGGEVEIAANRLILNDSSISAITRSSDGGNLNFALNDYLLLRNNSLISTEAGTSEAGGDGGDISINSDFVIALPNENSDIIANAFDGTGGQIKITATGIYGLTERNDLTTAELRALRSSDISASSQFGQQGTIALSGIDIDPIQSLDELSDDFINSDTLVATSCIARSNNLDASLTLTGGESLSQQPDGPSTSIYTTGTIQTLNESTIGQPLQEPEALYQLTDGRLILSRNCRESNRFEKQQHPEL